MVSVAMYSLPDPLSNMKLRIPGRASALENDGLPPVYSWIELVYLQMTMLDSSTNRALKWTAAP